MPSVASKASVSVRKRKLRFRGEAMLHRIEVKATVASFAKSNEEKLEGLSSRLTVLSSGAGSELRTSN